MAQPTQRLTSMERSSAVIQAGYDLSQLKAAYLKVQKSMDEAKRLIETLKVMYGRLTAQEQIAQHHDAIVNVLTTGNDAMKELHAFAARPDAELTEEHRAMKTCINDLSPEFKEFKEDYIRLRRKYDDQQEMRFKSEAKFYKPDATLEEVKEHVKSAQNREYALATRKYDAAHESYDYIVQRHQSILEIERSAVEVHELFRLNALLVEEQKERVTKVEEHVAAAKEDVHTAKETLRAAQKIKRRKCTIL